MKNSEDIIFIDESITPEEFDGEECFMEMTKAEVQQYLITVPEGVLVCVQLQ